MVRAWVVAHRVDLLQHLVDCGNSMQTCVSMVAAQYRRLSELLAF